MPNIKVEQFTLVTQEGLSCYCQNTTSRQLCLKFFFFNYKIYCRVLYMKATYIRPIESIFEGPETLKVWPWELQLPNLRCLHLEPLRQLRE